MCFALAVNAQYYYFPHINAGQNPGGLNTDDEYPVGGGQPAGWTSIHPGSATTPQWSTTVTIPFSFSFNGAAKHKLQSIYNRRINIYNRCSYTSTGCQCCFLPSALVPDNSVCCWEFQEVVQMIIFVQNILEQHQTVSIGLHSHPTPDPGNAILLIIVLC